MINFIFLKLLNIQTMKKIILLLLLSFSSFSHSISFKGCVDGKLKFYYETGHRTSINSRLTLVDKNGNALTGSCAYNELKSITNEGYFYVPQSLCNDYTRVKIQCHNGDYTGYFTVNKSSYCQTTLPIKIEAFNAIQLNQELLFNWKTSDEVNFSHFEIEGSDDFKEIFSLGTTSNNHFNYKGSFKYVRLKAIDLDGSYFYNKWLYIKKEEDTFILLEVYARGVLGISNNVKIFKLN